MEIRGLLLLMFLQKFSIPLPQRSAYCVVPVDSAERQIPMALLERVKEDFNKRYGGGKAATAQANSLNKEFWSKLKEHMQYCMDHPDEISKLAKVKAQVSEVKGVLMGKIEKVWFQSLIYLCSICFQQSSAHIDWKNPRSQTPPKLAPDPASQTASPERDDAYGSPWNPTHIGDSSTTQNDGHGAGALSTSSESSGSITRLASIDSFDSRWKQFLEPGESFLMISTVKKLQKITSKKVQLILTNKPKMIYVDSSKLVVKGNIIFFSSHESRVLF